MTSNTATTACESAQTPSTLVFIHGFLDGSAAWDAVVANLGDRAADALCVDLPGLGKRAGEPGRGLAPGLEVLDRQPRSG